MIIREDDTMNTYREGAVLDSDVEVYELVVRIFYPIGRNFDASALARRVSALTGDGSMVNYALAIMLKAGIVKEAVGGRYARIHEDRERIMRLLKYQFDKTP